MNRWSFFQNLGLAWVLAAGTGPARADRATDLARIHVEAIGGRQRIEALRALRATGTVVTSGKPVKFVLMAARPNLVRVETGAGGRTLMQGSDGVKPPWEFDSSASPARARPMAEAAAKTFLADAEFDDPLVAGPARGFAFDFVGKTEVAGRAFLRVLVTRNLTENSTLYLDPDTYLIMLRVEQRTSPGGRRVQVVTRYDDFRPVEGVLLPHDIALSIDGRFAQQTKIEVIDGNPTLAAGIFSASAAR